MSIADKLTLLNNTKQEIKSAIEAKGYVVGDIPFSQYPSVIDSMLLTEGGDLFQMGQSLNFDFINQRYGIKSLADGSITYTTNINDLGILTRASTATYWGPSGTLLEAAVDEARIQHEPVTGEPLGVLVESEATNGVPWSEDLDQEYWTKSELTVALSGEAFEVTESTAEAEHRLMHGYTVRGDGIPYAWSYVVKAGIRDRVRVFTNLRGIYPNAFATYNLNLGTVEDAHSAIDSPDIKDCGGGWYEISGVSVASGASPTRRIELLPLDSKGDSTYAGDDSAPAFLFKRHQIEEGTAPTSYIPTPDSPVTRAADNAVIDLSDVFNPDEGTLRITAQVPEGEVVASLGDMQVVSDSDEKKSYRMTYSDYTGVPTVTLGDGIHSKLEYVPEAQS